MKDRVVCIKLEGEIIPDHPKIIVGEIYTVIGLHYNNNYVELQEIPGYCYRADCFRPVDDTFGEWVEETIMKDVEIEELINA